MNWFRVAVGITSHPKTYALAEALGVEPIKAAGMVLAMLEWAATLEQEEVVVPVNTAAAILASRCHHIGHPRELVDALVRAGWLDLERQDRVRLHGWAELNGAAVRDAKSARERMRALRCSANRSPLPTDGRTDGRTNRVSVPTAQETPSVGGTVTPLPRPAPALPPPPAAPAKKARKVEAQAGGPEHQRLVEVWAAVYLARTGETYRYQQADFVQAALLHRQGVTPDEVGAAAERAFKPGIAPYLAVRSFKQLATRFSEVKVARPAVGKNGVLSAMHNVAESYDGDELFKPLGGGNK